MKALIGDIVESAGEDLADHPAVQAWWKTRPENGVPDDVELLKDGKPGWAVYRLTGVGRNGASVIAKRCDSDVAGIEYMVYREILPNLPISALRCFASIADDDSQYSWLFLEDAGDDEYSPDLEEHRILAGLWLGAMNSTAQRLPFAARLPDRGPAAYMEILRLAQSMTEERIEHPGINSDDRQMLRAIASHCDFLQTHWGRIERFCARMPHTLVHGDLSLWNARIRAEGTDKKLLIMDWESAGWGVPAADLAQFAGNALTPDVAAYWSVAQGSWPHLDLANVLALADLGIVFRWIDAVAWANWGFRESAIEWFITEIGCYKPELAEWARGTESVLSLE